jgi:hypothetical protein
MHWETLSEIFLSLSLLAGAAVNSKGALGLLRHPQETAANLGLSIQSNGSNSEVESTLVLLRLNGLLLIALALFYTLTALDPIVQVCNVGLAIVARLLGVVFYAVTMAYRGGPAQFKKYLMLNLGLAVAHALFLTGSPQGWAGLWSSFRSLKWLEVLF